MITEVRQWLATATGIQLSEDKLTITGSRYYIGDCLLPHNDRLQEVSYFNLLDINYLKF
jgi:hypothetical protein